MKSGAPNRDPSSGARRTAVAMRERARAGWRRGMLQWEAIWASPRGMAYRERLAAWRAHPLAGWVVLVVGTVLVSLLVAAVNQVTGVLANPGIVYLPFVAMLAYYWGWRFGALAAVLELLCVYVFFTAPVGLAKSLSPRSAEQLAALAAVTAFMLALVQLAASRREMAELEAGRFAALNSVGIALAGERDEARLLHLIAQTARDLTGADFAAFTLRPVDVMGQPLVPAEGNLFYLAAVVGVTKQQEELFRRMPLGGEGLLAPIFRQGVPVRVADALELSGPAHGAQASALAQAASESRRDFARRSAVSYAHDGRSQEHLVAMGVPSGHPIVRSFLGAPLLDSRGQVRGGLLLGHVAPGKFTREHEELLLGLTAEAAVAVENVRLYQSATAQAQELDTIFESIADGVLVVDGEGTVLRENATASRIRTEIARGRRPEAALDALLRQPAMAALAGETMAAEPVRLTLDGDAREIVASASSLRSSSQETKVAEHLTARPEPGPAASPDVQGDADDAQLVVIVWHDVTEARRLVTERRARSEAEARWKLLQGIVDELPTGVYLVRGVDARLILANRAATDVWGARWPEGMPMVEFLRTSGTRIYGPDGKPLAADDLATLRAIRSGEPVRHHQETIHHPDGVSLPILFNAVALDAELFAGNMPSASAEPDTQEPVALVVLQDMTALKEAERLKDEFIAIAAHELRNPTTAIKGYADMLRTQAERKSGHPLQDWQVEAITTIDQSTSRLVELTEDLLDVTRLQAGRLELHLEPHDLVALAHRVAKRLQVTTQQHTLTVRAEAPYVVVIIDVKRMEQVLTNLIVNAIKYSPDGGPVEIVVREDPAAGTGTLSVCDQGIGIPVSQQARMFGRFERAENARALGITGTGLGLYLSRELIVRHGGRIWFESIEGEGTTFHITLPLLAEEGPADDESNGVHSSQSAARSSEHAS